MLKERLSFVKIHTCHPPLAKAEGKKLEHAYLRNFEDHPKLIHSELALHVCALACVHARAGLRTYVTRTCCNLPDYSLSLTLLSVYMCACIRACVDRIADRWVDPCVLYPPHKECVRTHVILCRQEGRPGEEAYRLPFVRFFTVWTHSGYFLYARM